MDNITSKEPNINYDQEITKAILFQSRIKRCFIGSNTFRPPDIQRKQTKVFIELDTIDETEIIKLLNICSPNKIKFKIESAFNKSITIRFYE